MNTDDDDDDWEVIHKWNVKQQLEHSDKIEYQSVF